MENSTEFLEFHATLKGRPYLNSFHHFLCTSFFFFGAFEEKLFTLGTNFKCFFNTF